MALTASQIKSLHGQTRLNVLEKSDRDSLTIRVSTKGTISFYFRFRVQTKQQRICIGQYPIYSLSSAREKVLLLKKELAEGRDPRINGALEQSMGLDECINEWMSKRVEPHLRPKTCENYRSTVKHLYSKFPYQNVEDISAIEWLDLFDNIAARSQVTAGAVLRTCKALLRWCIRRQLISQDIPVMKFNTADVGGKSSRVADRVLTINEVKAVIHDTELSGAKPNMKAAITTLFVMGCRAGELNTMQWKHLHGDDHNMIWIVPAHLSKTNEPIRRPVPKVIRQKLTEMSKLYGDKGFVFSADPLSRGISITGQAIGRQLKRSAIRLIPKGGVSDYFCPHDCRRTIVTNLADHGVGLHVLEKHLGHKLVGVMAHYQKSDWVEQQRDSYELWSKLLFNKSECAS
jgi:integrase